MENQSMKFWASCPCCKRKFGIDPKYIVKYIERVLKFEKGRLAEIQAVLETAQKKMEQKKFDQNRNPNQYRPIAGKPRGRGQEKKRM